MEGDLKVPKISFFFFYFRKIIELQPNSPIFLEFTYLDISVPTLLKFGNVPIIFVESTYLV